MVRVHKSQLRITTDSERPEIEKTSNDTEVPVDVNKNVMVDSDEEMQISRNKASIEIEAIPDNTSVDLSRIKTGKTIQFKYPDSDENITAKVLSRAGKVGGIFLEFSGPEELISVKQSVDLSKVVDLKLNDVIKMEENVSFVIPDITNRVK
ncbi:hypothetical protein LOTGIDRAFT_175148 [Lottia gigantea]|uniref:Uncharacterized protein n=1 Tax=Lottia gigantea TaxID=225164 RepID=V4AFC3_LOTGI|nr:hypothetical protein LOTGIDRAFT_175148 [Lottia gigantea]ESO95572.1 hypothetical protein LOTGIDRAFT_175148 [Lottia gigantea]